MIDEPRMVTYDVPLRPTAPRMAQLVLPADLTAAEAERIAALIKAVAFEESTLNRLAQRISTAQQSPVPWSADWEQEVASELKTAGVYPTKKIIGQVWQLASTGASTSAQASKAARAWLDSRHSPPYPPHIRISKPGDVCWCGARIGGPGEQSRAHQPATQEELADDPGRSESGT